MRRPAAAVLILFLAACGGREQGAAAGGTATPAATQATATAGTLTPEQLGQVGAEIRKEPERAQEILSRHGLTEAAFEQAIRDVTESPEASKRYSAAYRKASA